MTNEGNEVYIDLKSKRYTWERPANIKKTYHLTINDINVCICSF